jgi:hypothetical protein
MIKQHETITQKQIKMKQLLIVATIMIFCSQSFGQSEKYFKAMQEKITALDTTRTTELLTGLSNGFERIGDAEKTQWLPYYYAALAEVNAGYFIMNGKMGGLADKLDPIADKAEALLNKAEALSKDNSEIYIIKKMIASLRLVADPMNRYMTYGPVAAEALDMAKKINPENPRAYYLEGQDKLFTPAQFGGSKEEAKKLFELAIQKFDTFKPADSLAPHWGRASSEHFLAEANK